MADSSNQRRVRGAAVGAAIGVVIGILVSIATDIPFAPEAGLVLGGLAGWLLGSRRSRR